MKLAIGAIFRNEIDYILEWLAWHEMAGFKIFYIADNGSTDGTRSLLEALAYIGRVKLMYQPVIERYSQLRAYERILSISLLESDAVMFIDADEFLVNESFEDGSEYKCIKEIIESPSVGMVSINWRTFGSSGLINQDPRPVVERFVKCASDTSGSKNGHLKSIAKTVFVARPDCHIHSLLLTDLLVVDSAGNEIREFVDPSTGINVIEKTGISKFVSPAPLRVNHYVIKSREEFLAKKMRRGSAMKGVGFVKGEGYFRNHDFSELDYIMPTAKIDRLKVRIDGLKSSLTSSPFHRELRGSVDVNSADRVEGWVVDTSGISEGLSVVICINTCYIFNVTCRFFRSDLKALGLSQNGLSGFRWVHARQLSIGDVVEVWVYANNFHFPEHSHVVIS